MPPIEITSVNGHFTVRAPKTTLTLLLMLALENHVGEEAYGTHDNPQTSEEGNDVLFTCFVASYATAV